MRPLLALMLVACSFRTHNVACTMDCDPALVGFEDDMLDAACLDVDSDNVTAGTCATSELNGDCNDNDARLWLQQALYVDADRDGVSSDELATVCTDGTLPAGYAAAASAVADCDDSNASVSVIVVGYVDNDGDGEPGSTPTSLCVAASTAVPMSGTDACDDDTDNWVSCLSCLDPDGDGHFTGCDRYVNRSEDACEGDRYDWTAPCGSCVDADGDGSFAGCDFYDATTPGPDCDDTRAFVHPGAFEPYDTSFDCSASSLAVDESTGIFVDATAGDDGFVGSRAAPVKSLAHALSLAEAQGKIVFAHGDFTTSTRLALRASVIGGFDAAFTTMGAASLIVGTSTSGVGLVDRSVFLQNLTFVHELDNTPDEMSCIALDIVLVETQRVLLQKVTTYGTYCASNSTAVHIEGPSTGGYATAFFNLSGFQVGTGPGTHSARAAAVGFTNLYGIEAEGHIALQVNGGLIGGGFYSIASGNSRALRVGNVSPKVKLDHYTPAISDWTQVFPGGAPTSWAVDITSGEFSAHHSLFHFGASGSTTAYGIANASTNVTVLDGVIITDLNQPTPTSTFNQGLTAAAGDTLLTNSIVHLRGTTTTNGVASNGIARLQIVNSFIGVDYNAVLLNSATATLRGISHGSSGALVLANNVVAVGSPSGTNITKRWLTTQTATNIELRHNDFYAKGGIGANDAFLQTFSPASTQTTIGAVNCTGPLCFRTGNIDDACALPSSLPFSIVSPANLLTILRPAGACRDTGFDPANLYDWAARTTPFFDIDEERRPLGSDWDIGPDEE